MCSRLCTFVIVNVQSKCLDYSSIDDHICMYLCCFMVNFEVFHCLTKSVNATSILFTHSESSDNTFLVRWSAIYKHTLVLIQADFIYVMSGFKCWWYHYVRRLDVNVLLTNAATCAVCVASLEICEQVYKSVQCEPPNNYCINILQNNKDGSRLVNRT